MRAVLQRVSSASVVVNGGDPRTIGPGLMILLGVKDGDDPAIIPKLAAKCAGADFCFRRFACSRVLF